MSRARDIYEKICAEGVSAILEFLEQRKSEELFLEFKRSENDGSARNLSDIDKKSLARAISGFGNSEGGVIVWGVYCTPGRDGDDVAKQLHPLIDVAKFTSQLNGAVSGCTLPPHPRVESYPIPVAGEQKGYVVTWIDKSEVTPHQTLPDRRYLIRAGSDFFPTPHEVLAGQFGRRPQPKIEAEVRITQKCELENGYNYKFDIILKNVGLGIGTDIYLNVFTESTFQGDFNPLMSEPAQDFLQTWSDRTSCFILSKNGSRLSPQAKMQATSIQTIHTEETNDIEYNLFCGCDKGPINYYKITKTMLDVLFQDDPSLVVTKSVKDSRKKKSC